MSTLERTAPVIQPEVLPTLLGRITGERVVIEFAPKVTSHERLCAGAVVRLATGHVHSMCAIDRRKAEHAFGATGLAMYEAAHALCESLTNHWISTGDAKSWQPPFEGASLSRHSKFSARDAKSALTQIIEAHSSIHTLLNAYEIKEQNRGKSVVEKIRNAVKTDVNAAYLSPCFNRQLTITEDAKMRVDFLGRNFACYFIQVVKDTRHVESSSERALGKIFELETIRRHVEMQSTMQIGLLESEHPNTFELIMIGARSDHIQRQVIHRIEALADRSEVHTTLLASVPAAAERVAHQERIAA